VGGGGTGVSVVIPHARPDGFDTTHPINLSQQMCLFLRNIHIYPRKIWLTRHAESVDQVSCLYTYILYVGGKHTGGLIQTPNPQNTNQPINQPTKTQSNNILGGDSGDLTEAGRQYVILLHKFIKRVRIVLIDRHIVHLSPVLGEAD
jgi:hypothetical protein